MTRINQLYIDTVYQGYKNTLQKNSYKTSGLGGEGKGNTTIKKLRMGRTVVSRTLPCHKTKITSTA